MMNKSDCEKSRYSKRTIGIMILPLAIVLSLIGGLVVPVIGLLFAAPLYLLSIMFIAGRDSKVCRLVLGDDE